MNCSDAHELLIDRLLNDLDANACRELDAHLELCAACRDEGAALEAAWSLLGADADRPSDGTDRERLVAAARRELQGSLPVTKRGLRKTALRIAVTVLWLVVGIGLGFAMSRGAGSAPADPQADGAIYMILVHEIESALDAIPADEMRAAGAAYRDWEARYRRSGELVEAAWLPPERSFWIEGRQGNTAPREFHLDDWEITYYWLIRAGDEQQALTIARTCPFLHIGAKLELRRVGEVDGGRS